MKTLGLFFYLLLFSTTLLAESAVVLKGSWGNAEGSPVDVIQTKTIIGSCGGALVEVIGVSSEQDGVFGFDNDSGALLIRYITPKSKVPAELRINVNDYGNIFSEFNSIKCIATKSGDRLVINSSCGGSACTGTSVFTINPSNPGKLPKDVGQAIKNRTSR